jgi:dihydrofolate reductase
MRLYIAQTIDGFIADERGEVAFLDSFPGEDYGYAAFVATVDAVVMGRATYDHMMRSWGWSYPGKRAVIMTSRPIDDLPGGAEASREPPAAIAERFPDAWIVGGGRTIASFLEAGLVREARLFTVPVLLGRGVRLFPDQTPGQGLGLVAVRGHPSGVVETTFWRA